MEYFRYSDINVIFSCVSYFYFFVCIHLKQLKIADSDHYSNDPFCNEYFTAKNTLFCISIYIYIYIYIILGAYKLEIKSNSHVHIFFIRLRFLRTCQPDASATFNFSKIFSRNKITKMKHLETCNKT